MNKIALSSLALDLKRVALCYFRGSDKAAKRFLEEAFLRRKEVNKKIIKTYLIKLLNDLDGFKLEKDKKKLAEDALLYSKLFENASLNL
jgi:hypothetical protein